MAYFRVLSGLCEFVEEYIQQTGFGDDRWSSNKIYRYRSVSCVT